MSGVSGRGGGCWSAPLHSASPDVFWGGGGERAACRTGRHTHRRSSPPCLAAWWWWGPSHWRSHTRNTAAAYGIREIGCGLRTARCSAARPVCCALAWPTTSSPTPGAVSTHSRTAGALTLLAVKALEPNQPVCEGRKWSPSASPARHSLFSPHHLSKTGGRGHASATASPCPWLRQQNRPTPRPTFLGDRSPSGPQIKHTVCACATPLRAEEGGTHSLACHGVQPAY